MIDNTEWAVSTIEKLHFEHGDVLVITTEDPDLVRQIVQCKPLSFQVPIIVKRPGESIEKISPAELTHLVEIVIRNTKGGMSP